MAEIWREIQNRKVIALKGFLFLFLGIFAGAILLMYAPSLQVAVLLAITVWAFCRFYFFAFYVLGEYVDPSFRFDGLYSFLLYWLSSKKVAAASRPKSEQR